MSPRSIRTASRASTPVSKEAIGSHLALLDPAARELTQKLAVWGGPATLAEIAALDGSSPVGLVGAAQTSIDAGVVGTGPGDTLHASPTICTPTSHCERLAPALRTVLHQAVADHPGAGRGTQVVAHHGRRRHRRRPQCGEVAAAQRELGHVPAMTVELLDTLPADVTASKNLPRAMHLNLATALTRTGQFTRAAQVAEEGLAHATTVEEITDLHQVLLFAVITKGDTVRAPS